jgi:hypothetical protein
LIKNKYPVVQGGMSANVIVWDRLISDLKITSLKESHCQLSLRSSNTLCCNHAVYYAAKATKAIGAFRKHSLNCVKKILGEFQENPSPDVQARPDPLKKMGRYHTR